MVGFGPFESAVADEVVGVVDVEPGRGRGRLDGWAVRDVDGTYCDRGLTS